jgi:hypothetical protein
VKYLSNDDKKKVVIKPDPRLKDIIEKGKDTSGIENLSNTKVIKKSKK